MEKDFDVGTILYVVITLVAVLIGLLGKRKKPTVSGSGLGQGKAGGEREFQQNLESAFNVSRDEEVEDDQELYGQEASMQEAVTRMRRERDREMEERTRGMWEEYEAMHGTEKEKESIAESSLEGIDEEGIRSEIEGEPGTGKGEKTVLTEVQEPADMLEVIELGEFEGASYFDIVRDFDAVTAVIFSAIINRTEY
jgi:hypothetical protein